MANPSVRLALIGKSDDSTAWRLAAANIQGASATVVADTIEAALKDQGGEFDAAVICTPVAQRQAASKLAAEANKHLLLD